jgi:putative restriction endonuclease
MLDSIPISQARVQRHRCCYLAYQRGKEAGFESAALAREELEEAELAKIDSAQDIDPTTRVQLANARRGQGIFRSQVSKLIGTCPLSGVSDVRFLRASHIKPWRVATNAERLDPYNGLMLAPHADHLFDCGWITFANDGSVLRSIYLPEDVWTCLRLNLRAGGRPFGRPYHSYLEYHRAEIFKR